MTRSQLVQVCQIATRRDVVLRALRVAVVVGSILIALNQGDVLLSSELDRSTLWKVLLTPIVPYLVSVFSSVAAIRDSERYHAGGAWQQDHRRRCADGGDGAETDPPERRCVEDRRGVGDARCVDVLE